MVVLTAGFTSLQGRAVRELLFRALPLIGVALQWTGYQMSLLEMGPGLVPLIA